jgi:adenine/guanine phosphoribosyltransferase-like PRPP-binding protein
MVQELGGVTIGVAVLVELRSLEGRSRLQRYPVEVVSFITYD